MNRLLLLVFACSSGLMGQDAVLCVLFDLSQSAENVRASYQSDFERVVDALTGDTYIFGAAITAHSLATGRFEIDREIPKYSPFADSKLTFRKKLQSAQIVIKEEGRKLLKGPVTQTTDVMGGIQLAEKAFQSAKAASARTRLLIVFSDMVEESARYNFQRENLTPARATTIVESERKGGRLPKLTGVQVWVAGAGGAAPEKFLQIQDFWTRYFAAASADFRKNRYGAGLMDFSVPHP